MCDQRMVSMYRIAEIVGGQWKGLKKEERCVYEREREREWRMSKKTVVVGFLVVVDPIFLCVEPVCQTSLPASTPLR